MRDGFRFAAAPGAAVGRSWPAGETAPAVFSRQAWLRPFDRGWLEGTRKSRPATPSAPPPANTDPSAPHPPLRIPRSGLSSSGDAPTLLRPRNADRPRVAGQAPRRGELPGVTGLMKEDRGEEDPPGRVAKGRGGDHRGEFLLGEGLEARRPAAPRRRQSGPRAPPSRWPRPGS